MKTKTILFLVLLALLLIGGFAFERYQDLRAALHRYAQMDGVRLLIATEVELTGKKSGAITIPVDPSVGKRNEYLSFRVPAINSLPPGKYSYWVVDFDGKQKFLFVDEKGDMVFWYYIPTDLVKSGMPTNPEPPTTLSRPANSH